MIRGLGLRPGFSLAVVLTLAAGIGAFTAMFSVVYGVLFRPLPYAEPASLVRLSEGYEGATQLRPGALLSNVTYHAWNDAGFRSIDGIEGYVPLSDAIPIEIGGQRELARIGAVTPGLFQMLGIEAVVGRALSAEDGLDGRDAVVVLGESYWRRRFNADPDVLGRTVVIGAMPRTVVGIVPRAFTLPDASTDLWRPMNVSRPEGPAANPSFSAMFAIARLRPDATLQQVTAEGTTVARRRVPKPLGARLTFGDGGDAFVRAVPMVVEMTGAVRSGLLIVGAGIVCMLVISCVNAASLLLSRTTARMHELVVRSALGASRRRLARDLLASSALLAGIAAALGLLLAFWALRVAAGMAPADFPRLDDVRLDLPAFGVAVGAAFLTALVAAIPAIWQTHRVDSAAAFSRGHTGAQPRTTGRRSRGALIATEASFAVVVLVVATLLARSFVELTQVDPGYTPEQALIVDIHRPGTDQASAVSFAPIMATALERIRALPGVEAAAFGVPTPLDVNTSLAAFPRPGTGRGGSGQLLVPGATQTPPALARFYLVTPGFNRALDLRLRAGRFFERADQAGDVVRWVVNEEFARLYLPPDPVGQRFPWTRAGRPTELEILGIVGNVLKNGNAEAPAAEVYGIRRDTDPFFNPTLVVRTADDAAAPAADVRRVLQEAAPDAVVTIVPLADRVADSLAMPRVASVLSAGIALVAALLTAFGIAASAAYDLATRTREFGVRVAVGATRRQLVSLVVRDGVVPACIGIGMGLCLSAAVTHAMRGVLFEINPLDTVSFAVAGLALLPVVMLACLVPALHWSRADPLSALKRE